MQTETFIVDKECLHSRRYACTHRDFPIKTVYVDRSYCEDSDQIVISIKAAGEK